MMPDRIFISLGSNLGQREQHLAQARQQISREIGPIVTSSSLYETAAWGKLNQPAFINQVLEIQTLIQPEDLLNKIMELEQAQGRVRHERWGARTIDIDILFYGDKQINTSALTIPHPQLQSRMFVLAPLGEIAPDFMHPVLQKTISQLLDECPDELEVKRLQA
jgi:2-amino-4-hydroxy-6-hydroxymethyldihydropteridine diphosphokinase